MNESINLTKILKYCPKGTEFYHAAYGRVWFRCINLDCSYPIRLSFSEEISDDACVTSKGFIHKNYDGECLLFPSKYQRDWSKFSAPWYNPEKYGKEEYGLKSSKDEDVRKFIQYIEKQAKAYKFNLPNRDYDIYAFAKDLLVWLEKQDEDKKEINNFDVLPGLYKCVHRMFDGTPDGRLLFEIGNVYKCLSKHDRAEFEVSYGHSVYLEDPVVCKYFIPFESKVEQASSQTNERAWLYLVSDVLTWKDGIGQYLDDTRVQELAKRLCSEYAKKLYIPSNSSNTRNNEQKTADKIEPRFKVGDWVVRGDTIAQIVDIQEQYYVGLDINGKDFVSSRFLNSDKIHLWTIQDANDGNVIHLGTVTAIFKKYIGREKCICYCSFCKDGGFEIPIENGEDNIYGCYNATPATKEQRDLLFQKIKEVGYNWVAETKTLEKLVEPKFDPKTLKPFDKVLVRRGSEDYNVWFPDFVSDPPNANDNKTLCMCVMEDMGMVIPYNDETKHLVGTKDEAPEFYRYWED